MHLEVEFSILTMYLDHGKTWHVGANIPGISYGQDKSIGDFCPDENQVLFVLPTLCMSQSNAMDHFDVGC